ncbi:MAG: hypothetical protein JWM27_1794, partial [Gemmatimonadetes bacterium]|nr:hypothetical protein [Gemmatimonadota bacterium]
GRAAGRAAFGPRGHALLRRAGLVERMGLYGLAMMAHLRKPAG